MTVFDGTCNGDYTGLKWFNINQFWQGYCKYDFIADACNHNQMMNDETIQKNFLLCIIIRH